MDRRFGIEDRLRARTEELKITVTLEMASSNSMELTFTSNL
jgi:hypothetical protein